MEVADRRLGQAERSVDHAREDSRVGFGEYAG